MPKKKNHFSTVLLCLVFLAGLSLLLYPTVSDYWNSFHASQAISAYSDAVGNLNEEEYRKIIQDAKRYNRRQASSKVHLMSDSEMETYMSMLNFMGNGQMGHIEIPSIGVSLPISHTTSDMVLQSGVGHIEWTSLPVGGSSTHCALSGHRGLPSAKLFTNLDKLREGDVFVLRILDEVLTYEVDQILIVEPQEIKDLEVVEGQDYCTLVTCTPYGVNTHRLLVRGHRIETQKQQESVRIMSEAIQVDELIVSPILFVPILILFLIGLSVFTKIRRR